MTTSDRTYNGYTNYETWVVALWIDNDQGSQEYWHETAKSYVNESEATDVWTKDQAALFGLADRLKEEHFELLPKLEGFSADLLNGAMAEVNWREIAQSIITSAKEDAS